MINFFSDLRRGWWRITEEEDLYKIIECLHGRGYRERELKRMLSRYLDDGLETGGKVNFSKKLELIKNQKNFINRPIAVYSEKRLK